MTEVSRGEVEVCDAPADKLVPAGLSAKYRQALDFRAAGEVGGMGCHHDLSSPGPSSLQVAHQEILQLRMQVSFGFLDEKQA